MILTGPQLIRRPSLASRPVWPYRLNKNSPQAKGLVAWWPITPHYPRVLDATGRSHDGTGASYAPRVEVQGGPYLNNTGAPFPSDIACDSAANGTDFDLRSGCFMVSCWIRTSVGTYSPIMSAINAGAFNGWELAVGAVTAGKLDFWNGTSWQESLTSVNDGKWHLCAYRYNGANYDVFLDGVLDRSQAATNPSTNAATLFHLGLREGNSVSNQGWNGDFFDLRVYKQASAFPDAIAWQMYDSRTRWDLYEQDLPLAFAAPAATVTEIPSYMVGRHRQPYVNRLDRYFDNYVTPAPSSPPTAAAFKDRVRETTTVTGTNAALLLGRLASYQSFANALQNNSFVWYAIEDVANDAWEVGKGVFYSTPAQVVRFAGTPSSIQGGVYDGSSGPGSLVNFGVGTKNIFLTFPAAAAGFGGFSG